MLLTIKYNLGNLKNSSYQGLAMTQVGGFDFSEDESSEDGPSKQGQIQQGSPFEPLLDPEHGLFHVGQDGTSFPLTLREEAGGG